MKAEHRKELQTNELADWLGRQIQGFRDNKRSWITAGLVVLAVGIVIGVYLWWSRMPSATAAALAEVQAAGVDLKLLEQIAEKHKSSIAGRTARFEMARIHYQDGVRDLAAPEIRAGAVGRLLKARELYSQLASECRDSPVLAQEAMMWAARAEETLIGTAHPDQPGERAGSIDRAIEAYDKLAKTPPETFMTKVAAERAKLLQEKRSDIEAFYGKLNEPSTKLKK